MTATGTLYVIAAPSGAGKTSLVRQLTVDIPHLQVSISHTTRAPRSGERDGRDYYFISESEFLAMVAKKAFLEHAQVFGFYYGTSEAWVNAQLAAGIDTILEIDWQGARQIQLHHPQAVSIFILPPSLAALNERLIKRAQDDIDVVKRRLSEAKQDISHSSEFDYLVINEKFDLALRDLHSIINAKRLEQTVQVVRHAALLASFVR